MLSLVSTNLYAASLGVAPIRIDLDARLRTGAITVSNDDKLPVRVQTKLVRWTQDEQGQDVFTDSADLVYFPRLMNLEGQGQRLVRLGLQQTPPDAEQAYRLFIEELPAAAEPGQLGTRVAIAVRFGIPVFVSPTKPDLHVSLAPLQWEAGQLRVTVRNTGNVHVRLQDLALSNELDQTSKVDGWYLLPNTQRAYLLPLPGGACRGGHPLKLRLRAEELGQDAQFTPTVEQCGR